MRIKLVAKGGGTRYPLGVGFLKACEELGIEIEEAIGTSAGALLIGMAASGRDAAGMQKLCGELLPGKFLDPRLLPVWPFSKGHHGLIKGDKLLKVIRDYFPKDYVHTAFPVHVVTHNWTHGSNAVFSAGDLPLHVRASMSLPIFDMVQIGEDLYEDGGVSGNFLMDYDAWAVESDAPVIGLAYKSVGAPTRREPPATKLARAAATVDDMIAANDREHIEDAEAFSRIITLETKHSGLNLLMSAGDVEEMIQEGYEQALDALQKLKR